MRELYSVLEMHFCNYVKYLNILSTRAFHYIIQILKHKNSKSNITDEQ